jgi:hypothetical protein
MIGDRLLNKLQRRPRASFDFVQEGRFQKQAELQRLKVNEQKKMLLPSG